MNFLGIDWGKSKLGLALGSDLVKIATPFKVLKFKTYKEVIAQLEIIVEQENIEALVIGRPINLAGENFRSEDFENFLKQLKELGKEIFYEDERLTTKVAIKKNFERSKKNHMDDDDLAATEILQSYFDKV